jgi:hypothetical protein
MLLKCVRRELMLDPLLKKAFNVCILEIRPIISPGLFYLQSELILSPSQESLQCTLGFRFSYRKNTQVKRE